jgi:hypothetical protein
MTTFRLSQGQVAHCLFALGAATVQATAPQDRGEYVRLANVISQGCAPQTGGSYELNLNPQQTDQMRLAVNGVRSLDNMPPEYGRWLNDLEQIFQANPQSIGATTR